jgi:lysophospholipase L1-like esterase
MLFLAGLGKVWHRWHSSGGERRKIVERLTGPTGAALIIGDSITQQQEISSLCGLPVVNAGIASSRVEDWTSLAPEVVRKLKPKIVIYALGINDARTHFPFNADQWARTYSKLRRGGFILGVLPVQNHPTISNERIAEMNARLSREPGFIPPFPTDDLTRDGVHLNLAGKRRWERQVQMVCTRQAKPSDKHPIKA